MKQIFKYLTPGLILIFSLVISDLSAQRFLLDDFMDKIKADSMVEALQIEEFQAALVRHERKGKWGLYEIRKERDFLTDDALRDTTFYELESVVIPMKFDSLSFGDNLYLSEVIVVKNRGKYGLLKNLERYGEDSWKDVKCQFDKIVIKKRRGDLIVLVKDDGKWGLINWQDGRMIFDPLFDEMEQVPLYVLEERLVNLIHEAKKKLKADLVLIDFNSIEGVFKARNKRSGKWGMYQSYNGKDIDVIIPQVYDSIDFFRPGGKFTSVYQKGKTGIYTSKWRYRDNAKETVPCIYDDFQIFKGYGATLLAMKRDGYWGWVDFLTGEEKSEFKYETPKDLP
jgi:hypothetical protein